MDPLPIYLLPVGALVGPRPARVRAADVARHGVGHAVVARLHRKQRLTLAAVRPVPLRDGLRLPLFFVGSFHIHFISFGVGVL